MSTGRVDLIAYVGPGNTGGYMLDSALARLRPVLLRNNVAYVGGDDLDALPSVTGWRANALPEPGEVDRFAADLADLADRERREASAVSTEPKPPNVIVTSQRLLGRQPVGRADAEQFRPHATAAIEQLIAAVGAKRTRVVLFCRRQDRLMERAYVGAVMDGRSHTFDEQFPNPEHPVLDFGELADRIQAVPGVVDVVIHPFEMVRVAPQTALRAVLPHRLRALDTDAGAPFDLGRIYSRIGIQLALAMNSHIDSIEEHALVREFILARFGTSEVAGTRLLDADTRAAVLAAYAEANVRLFRRYLPQLPENAYLDDAGTRLLRPKAKRTKQQRPAG